MPCGAWRPHLVLLGLTQIILKVRGAHLLCWLCHFLFWNIHGGHIILVEDRKLPHPGALSRGWQGKCASDIAGLLLLRRLAHKAMLRLNWYGLLMFLLPYWLLEESFGIWSF